MQGKCVSINSASGYQQQPVRRCLGIYSPLTIEGKTKTKQNKKKYKKYKKQKQKPVGSHI